jgi:5'-nucleotidase
MGLNSCNLNSRDIKITILHTNDVHSQIDPFPSNHNLYPNKGGFAKRASLFKELITINPNTLIFDAGDIFQGTPYFNFFQGELELNLMKKMGYNAATIGNHEFDAGLKTFKKNILNNDFQFISSNYDFTNTELEGLVDKYKIYNKGGVKIGVFGLGIELRGLVDPLLYDETKYYDPINIAKDLSSKLKYEKKCDLVICISHLGHEYQNDKISDTKLAKLTSNIDLIIGGHTHTLLKEALILKNSLGKEVIINQVGSSGIFVGKIDFYFTNSSKSYDESIVEV